MSSAHQIDSIVPSYSCPKANNVRNAFQSVPAWTNHLQENAALKARLDATLGTAGLADWASWCKAITLSFNVSFTPALSCPPPLCCFFDKFHFLFCHHLLSPAVRNDDTDPAMVVAKTTTFSTLSRPELATGIHYPVTRPGRVYLKQTPRRCSRSGISSTSKSTRTFLSLSVVWVIRIKFCWIVLITLRSCLSFWLLGTETRNVDAPLTARTC